MKKSVLNDLCLEPRPKTWQNFDTEGIMHKEFVPPGQTVNGKFYCNVLKQMSEVIRHNVQTSGATTPGACYHDNAPDHVSLIVQQFLVSKNMSHPPPSLLTGPCHLWFFFLFPKVILKLKV
jgi:hypothetical protein